MVKVVFWNVMQKAVAENSLNAEQKQLHQYFSFKLAAVRNLYLSKFLKDHNSKGQD